jgi:hypothetical protein
VEGLEVGAALSAGAHDQEWPVGAGGELAGGEQRERRGPPGGDDGAVEKSQPFARRGLHDDNLTPDGRLPSAGVSGVHRHQLGDRDAPVGCGHHQQDAIFREGERRPRRGLYIARLALQGNLPDGLREVGVRQAGRCLLGGEDLHRYPRVSAFRRPGEKRSMGRGVDPSVARSARISPTTLQNL